MKHLYREEMLKAEDLGDFIWVLDRNFNYSKYFEEGNDDQTLQIIIH